MSWTSLTPETLVRSELRVFLLTLPALLLGLGCTAGGEKPRERQDPPQPAASSLEAAEAPPPSPWRDGLLVIRWANGGDELQFLADGAEDWRVVATLENPPARRRLFPGGSPPGRVLLFSGETILGLEPPRPGEDNPVLRELASTPSESRFAHDVALAEGPDGELWFAQRLYATTLQHYGPEGWTPAGAKPPGQGSFGPVFDPEGSMFVLGGGALHSWDLVSNAWEKVADIHGYARGLVAHPKGGVVVLTEDELTFAYRTPEGDWTTRPCKPGVEAPKLLAINAKGLVGVGNWDGEVVTTTKDGPSDRRASGIHQAPPALDKLALDTRERVWAGTTLHLYISEPGRARVDMIEASFDEYMLFGAGPSPETLAPHLMSPEARQKLATWEAEWTREEQDDHYSLQLATRSSLADAQGLARELADGLAKRELDLPVAVLERGEYHVVMAGELESRAAAEAVFDEVKAILGQGGFVRDMSEFCPTRIPAGIVERCSSAP